MRCSSERFYKAATCLSLTLISAIAPCIPVYGQVINDYLSKPENPYGPGLSAPTGVTVIPAPGTGTASTTNSSTTNSSGSSPPSPGAAADAGQSAVWTPGGTTAPSNPAATTSAGGAQDAALSAPSAPPTTSPAAPFSNVKDPLVTHPGVDDAQAKSSTLPNSGTAIPNMMAPVFKPGSKAAVEQAKEAAAAKERLAQPTKLYGRIEQLTSGTGANFPIVLKAMTAQMDNTPTKKLSGKAGEDSSTFSGAIAKNFPSDFRGNWGGTLTVWNVVQDPSCYKIDSVEATKLARIFRRGAQGNVNFNFTTDARGGNSLAPAQVLFMAPPDPAANQAQMQQMMGGQSMAAMGPMGQMMQQMSAGMSNPVVFYFGEGQTDAMSKGLSGNSFTQHTMRNNIRMLANNVLEQQIVAEMDETVAATGRPRKGYSESVLRFTKLDATRMYVQAAQVSYWGNHAFKDKVIFYGYVNKGTLAQTNPYSAMMGSMGGAGQIPGMGSIFGGGGGGTGGNGQIPGMPGGLEDALKKMFGGQ